MSIGPINNLSTGYLQSALRTALQDAGLNTTQTTNTTAVRQDDSRISSFAQLLSTLQNLQQSDPAKYKQVTEQIATDLQKAAENAQKDGNPTAAKQLNQLSKDFLDASKTGDLPNIQDLAQAARGHHRHHHSHAVSADSGATPDDSTTSGTTPSNTASQFLSALASNGAGNDALNPISIIAKVLSNAGITASGN